MTADDRTRLAELEAAVARLGSDLLDLTAAVTVDVDSSEPAIGLTYGTLDAWVNEYFCVVFVRSIGGEFRWCAQWREHPEAVTRLEALWRAWEALRLDANLGMVTWLTSFLDTQLAHLMSRSGTFRQCTGDRHLVSRS